MTTDVIVGLIVLGFVVVVVAAIAALTVRIVPAVHVAVVERFGRYHRTVGPGIIFIIPLIERTLPYTDLRAQSISYEHEPVITKDNYVIQVSMVVYHQIKDAQAAECEMENLGTAMEEATRTSLRDIIGDMPLEQTLNSGEELNAKLRLTLDDAVRNWGVSVLRVEIQEIVPPDDAR